jgi:hypothetical protein
MVRRLLGRRAMKRFVALVLLLLPLSPVLACTTEYVTASAPTPAPPLANEPAADADDAAIEASHQDAGKPDADNGGACNAIVDDAPKVHVEAATSDPPTMTGGAIADGKYVLTHFTVYPDVNGNAPGGLGQELSLLVVIKGQSWEQVATAGGMALGPASWTLAASGSKLTAKKTCPDQSASSFTYTATATTLLRTWTQGGYPVVQTLAKQ